jgi:hypothetical protein
MRAIGLVLLSIAIMALLLTDADAKRHRSSAQGSQAAGASRSWCANNSVWPRCGGSVAFADPIRFRARRMGRDIPGRQVRRARAARGYAETREAAMAAFAKSWRRE